MEEGTKLKWLEIGGLISNLFDDWKYAGSPSVEVSQGSTENQIIKNEDAHETQSQLCKLFWALALLKEMPGESSWGLGRENAAW
jgi:hypothetical protein